MYQVWLLNDMLAEILSHDHELPKWQIFVRLLWVKFMAYLVEIDCRVNINVFTLKITILLSTFNIKFFSNLHSFRALYTPTCMMQLCILDIYCIFFIIICSP